MKIKKMANKTQEQRKAEPIEFNMTEQFFQDSKNRKFYSCRADGAYHIWRAFKRIKDRKVIPFNARQKVKYALDAKGWREASFMRDLFEEPTLQDEIVTYREGKPVVIVTPCHLSWINDFPKSPDIFINRPLIFGDDPAIVCNEVELGEIRRKAITLERYLENPQKYSNLPFYFPIERMGAFTDRFSRVIKVGALQEITRDIIAARVGGRDMLDGLEERIDKTKREKKEHSWEEEYMAVKEIEFNHDIFSRAGLLLRKGISTLRPLSLSIGYDAVRLSYVHDMSPWSAAVHSTYKGCCSDETPYDAFGISPNQLMPEKKLKYFNMLDETLARLRLLSDQRITNEYLFYCVHEAFAEKREGEAITVMKAVYDNLKHEDRTRFISEFIDEYERELKGHEDKEMRPVAGERIWVSGLLGKLKN
jgi:hypothetical protein